MCCIGSLNVIVWVRCLILMCILIHVNPWELLSERCARVISCFDTALSRAWSGIVEWDVAYDKWSGFRMISIEPQTALIDGCCSLWSEYYLCMSGISRGFNAKRTTKWYYLFQVRNWKIRLLIKITKLWYKFARSLRSWVDLEGINGEDSIDLKVH